MSCDFLGVLQRAVMFEVHVPYQSPILCLFYCTIVFILVTGGSS